MKTERQEIVQCMFVEKEKCFHEKLRRRIDVVGQ